METNIPDGGQGGRASHPALWLCQSTTQQGHASSLSGTHCPPHRLLRGWPSSETPCPAPHPTSTARTLTDPTPQVVFRVRFYLHTKCRVGISKKTREVSLLICIMGTIAVPTCQGAEREGDNTSKASYQYPDSCWAPSAGSPGRPHAPRSSTQGL